MVCFSPRLRDIVIHVFGMTPSKRETQLKRVNFVKMRIVDNFPEYAQKHIKRKVKKDPR